MVFGQKRYIHRILKRQVKALIRQCVCSGWSKPLLVPHTIVENIMLRLFSLLCSHLRGFYVGSMFCGVTLSVFIVL